MRATGVDGWRKGWVAVTLEDGRPAGGPGGSSPRGQPLRGVPGGSPPRGQHCAVRAAASLAELLDAAGPGTVGIDMPLGLLESGWREADRAARGLLGPRRSSVFAIPPRAVWAETTHRAASQRCRELTGQGLSVHAWGLRAKLLEANAYRDAGEHPLYEVHPELAFAAMAGEPLPHSKHTAAGRELRRELLAAAGIVVAGLVPGVPLTDTLDAAAVAWSARRIGSGRAVTLPARPQRDRQGREITIRY